jgi:restriction system protein
MKGSRVGNRKRKQSVCHVLLDAPWWVSALLALASYVIFNAAVPAAMAANHVLRGVVTMNRLFAWAPATMFAFLVLLVGGDNYLGRSLTIVLAGGEESQAA